MILEPWAAATIAVLAGYLLGSIPFGLLVTRAAGAGDLRRIGSGNIGATNVLRTGRKGLAALTLLLDGAKGAAAVLVFAFLSRDLAQLAGLAAFLGHLYPVWLRFRGGKGVATMLGVALAMLWPAGVAFAVVWLLAALATRHSSIGGMAAAIVAPVAAALIGDFGSVLLFLVMTLFVLWRHRANFSRLLDGTEPKIGDKVAGVDPGLG